METPCAELAEAQQDKSSLKRPLFGSNPWQPWRRGSVFKLLGRSAGDL